MKKARILGGQRGEECRRVCAAVEALAKGAIETFGHLDVWINNAGGSPIHAPLTDLPREEWDATLRLNLTAIWVCTNTAARHMRDGGRIMRIDDTGKTSTLLEKDKTLVHPVDVAVGGKSDTIVVADNIIGTRAWTVVGDLGSAGPLDTAYQFDGEAGTVRFGDGVHGRVPATGSIKSV